MSKKVLTLVLVVVALAALLSGCVQRASTAPQATPTVVGGSFPEPAATSSDDLMLGLQLTATAAAGGSGEAPILTTPGTPGAESTPLPEIKIDPTTGAVIVVESTPVASATPDMMVLPTVTPQLVVAPTFDPANRPATYTLQQGEFPYCIARRFNVNPNDLLSLNSLSEAASQSLNPGLVLKIPTSGSFPAQRWLKAHPATHTVGMNETIYSIACIFGDVDPMQIASANGLTSPYKLTVGQTLQIP